MPNVFDRFDAPAAGKGNVFDKFDAPASPPPPEKVYYNDAGQPFTASGKPVPQQPADTGYTGSILPLRRDESGLHLAVPEAIAAPARGVVTGGARALGVGEAGKDPLRPLSPDEMAAASMGATAAPGAMGGLGNAILRSDPEAVTQIVRGTYYRGIKPGTTMTAPQRAGYESNVRQAVDAIIGHRGGRALPQRPEEFSTAVAETKSVIYDRYSGMAREAEQKGARVALSPAVERLRNLANDPMQDAAAVNEAKRLLALVPGGNATITPTRAEEIMAHLNERATGFDTLGTKGAGAVFREAAGALRGSLLEAVHGAGFPDYGKLRQTYGSLVHIEDDVGRAAGRI